MDNNVTPVLFLLKSLCTKMRRFVDDNTEYTNNLSAMQYGIILYICNSGKENIYQKDIQQVFELRRPSATNILQKMERQGLITRAAVNRDARLKKIFLTDAARALYEDANADITRIESQIINGLSKEELHTFFSVLSKIKSNIA